MLPVYYSWQFAFEGDERGITSPSNLVDIDFKIHTDLQKYAKLPLCEQKTLKIFRFPFTNEIQCVILCIIETMKGGKNE